MRTTIAIVVTLAVCAACGKSGNEGAEEAKRQAEQEQKEKAASGGVAKKISPPVPGRAKLDCTSVIKPELYQQALGEVEPITVTNSDAEPDAAASCSLRRGGVKLTKEQQAAKLKKEGRLGVLPGDEICHIATFCWTIEDAERFRKKCAEMKDKDDDSLGFYACVLIVATGADDVKRWRFFDEDTKCVFQVRAGPSNVDNDLIAKCAKAAHGLIGPNEIKVGAATAPAEAAPAGSGSAK